MASMQEYLEQKTDEELRNMLRAYCMGRGDMMADVVLCICQILAQRDACLPDPHSLFLSLCRMYC